MAWVHGCVLDHDHPGEHHAPAYHVGEQQYWLRWDDTGPARIEAADAAQAHGHVESSRPGQPRRQPAPPPSTATYGTSTTPAQPSESTDATSEAEALWAIARAIERLADIVGGGAPGRHSRHNGSDPSGEPDYRARHANE